MSNDKQTPLGALVTAGDQQTAAEKITDSIFMVKDISNAYLVTTADGDLLVNTGFLGNGQRNKALFAPHRTGPLRRIIVTQAHPDHYGALPEQLEDGTQVIAGAGFTATCDYFEELGPFLNRRSGKLWASLTRRDGPPPTPPKVVPDIPVTDRHAFEQGGRRFDVMKTPGGETLCSVFVWLPDDRIVFTGNLFGPVWRAMPNLVTMRGDKPRLVRAYLRSVEEVRALAPELLITGHGEPDPRSGEDPRRPRHHACRSLLDRARDHRRHERGQGRAHADARDRPAGGSSGSVNSTARHRGSFARSGRRTPAGSISTPPLRSMACHGRA